MNSAHKSSRTRLSLAAPICLAVTLALWVMLAGPGCSATARRDETVATPVRLTSQQQQGRKTFMFYCNQCHVGGAAGLGPALNDKPLPEWAIKYQVRHGIGPMPAFSEEVINDDQLEAVVRYLKAIRARDSQLAAQ